MSANTQAYYEYRAEKARILAAAAIDPQIATIHLEMAERYDLLAKSGANDEGNRARTSNISTAGL